MQALSGTHLTDVIELATDEHASEKAIVKAASGRRLLAGFVTSKFTINNPSRTRPSQDLPRK
jgi:hypothetical protein